MHRPTWYAQIGAHIDTLSGHFQMTRKVQTLSVSPPVESILLHYKGAATPSSPQVCQPDIMQSHQGHCWVSVYKPSLHFDPSSTPLLVTVPGLGGHQDSAYAQWVAIEASRLGFMSLLFAPRGSGNSSPGFFHAGWYQDLVTLCQHPQVSKHTERYLLGFSMGGHKVCRLACALEAQTLFKEIFACCPALDLQKTAHFLDQKAWKVYRSHLLKSVKKVAQSLLNAIDQKILEATPLQKESLRKSLDAPFFSIFDRLAISQLLGYQDADEYYLAESAHTYLKQLHTPLHLALNLHDPFIPYQSQLEAIHPYLGVDSLLELSTYSRGGHMYGGGWHDESAFGACLRWIEQRRPASLSET